MRFVILFLGLLFFPTIYAQIGTGQWRMHIPASNALDVAAGNGMVIAALNSGVVEYDIDAAENRVLNNLNALSDIKVTCVVFEPVSKSFFIGYENGNIDQITSSSAIINIPAIKLAQIAGNKRINKMIAANGRVYVATGFSVVVINPGQNEVQDTWYPTSGLSGVNDVAFLNDSVYALTNDKLYRGLATNAFLANPSQWTADPRLPVPAAAKYRELAVAGNELYFSRISDAYNGDSVMKLNDTGYTVFLGQQFPMEILRFEVIDGLFYTYYADKTIFYNADASVNYGIEHYGETPGSPRKVVHYDGTYWVADEVFGLVRFGSQYNYTFIQREGPPKSSFFSLTGSKDKVLVTGGIQDRVIFAYSLAGAYAFKDEAWKLYDQSTQAQWTSDMWDLSIAAINPDNTDQMALGSYSKDALCIVNGDQISQVYNASNSGLEATTLGNNSVCISGMEYDSDGNLWIANGYSTKPLKVLLKDGTWRSFSTGTATEAKYTTKIVVDGNGHKWFGVYDVGLVGYHYNETASADAYKLLKFGEGIGNLPSNNITALAVDFDNEIWIGTDNGFAVLYNSSGVFSSANYDASRILVTYEGNVENLLGNTPITDIEIDGGNRKWIATASTGIFLLSADGQEVISQFTKENSPLISNNIMDMAFNETTGELFIITDLGLVSYRTDASSEDPNYGTTTVFPNPVKPDYFGPITIQGIRYDSDVKITDVAGNLVYQTTSNGGTATWNGKRLTGEDVASGVYLIWTATNTGEKGKKVGKVVVIR